MQKSQSHLTIPIKILVYSALFAAMGAVLGQLLAIRPAADIKYTLDKCILFLSGMLLGPVVGGMVGFVADFVGGQFFGVGFSFLLCPPAVLYGVFGGLFRHMLARKLSLPRLTAAYACPVILGSVLYQSFALALRYNPATLQQAVLVNLASRSVQFAIMLVVEVAILYALFKTGIFTRAGLWPPVKLSKPEDTAMTAQQAIEFIHSVSWKGSIPGLERTQELLRRMGDPQKKLKFVHIAGTNGKGSTAAMTASILQKAGYRTGLYTSPYIYRFNERMQINGQPIADEELGRITAWVKPLAQSMDDVPTEFELVSAIAFAYFQQNGCDIVVLEVGMGGSLDSTNVIDAPEVAVITNIGLDHTDVLGKTVEQIARTKAGIIKPGCHVVAYRGTPGVEAVLEEVCIEQGAELSFANFDGLRLISHSLEGQVFDCGERKMLELPLLGVHQLHNASVVLSVADALTERGWQITEQNIYDGIREVSWPGRFDIVGRDPLFIIDGGHNPQCIEALAKNIRDYLADRKIIALTGVLADKDYVEMYEPILPLVEEFVCITPPNPRKLEAAELAAYLRKAGATATACDSIPEGVKTAIKKAGKSGVVLSFGSLYTIGQIHDALN